MASKGRMLDKNAFLQALIDNLSSRLENHVSGTEDFTKLLAEFDLMDSNKWPSDVESPWLTGESRIKS